MNFQLPGNSYLYAKQDTDFLQLCGAYDGACLALNLSVHTQYGDNTEQQTVDLSANVYVASQPTSNYDAMRFLTTVRSEDVYYTNISPGTVKLSGHISAAALREIEEERGHGDLYIVVRDLRGILFDKPPTRLHQTQRGTALSVRVRAGEWAEQLEKVTDSAYVDILVPMTSDPELARAASRVREARHQIRIGEYNACAAELRKAIEPARVFYGTLDQYSAAFTEGVKAKDRTEAQRYAILVQGRFNWLTTFIHDDEESIKGVDMDRTQAVEALAAVAGILHRLAQDKAAVTP